MRNINKIIHLNDDEYLSQTNESTSTIDRFNTLIIKGNESIARCKSIPALNIQFISAKQASQTPNYLNNSTDLGFMNFDLTEQMPKWWNGAKWVKAIRIHSQTNSTATDLPTLVNDFNSLLNNLRNAGIMDL